jgi:hypothetical protein
MYVVVPIVCRTVTLDRGLGVEAKIEGMGWRVPGYRGTQGGARQSNVILNSVSDFFWYS